MGFGVSLWTTTGFSVSLLPSETFPLIQHELSINGSNMGPSHSLKAPVGPPLAAVPSGHVCPLQGGFAMAAAWTPSYSGMVLHGLQGNKNHSFHSTQRNTCSITVHFLSFFL